MQGESEYIWFREVFSGDVVAVGVGVVLDGCAVGYESVVCYFAKASVGVLGLLLEVVDIGLNGDGGVEVVICLVVVPCGD